MKLLMLSFDMSQPRRIKTSSLHTIYHSVKSYLSFRAVQTPVGYLIDDESIISELDKYRKRWVEKGGRPDGLCTYFFDVSCANVETARMVTNSIYAALYARLDTVAAYYSKQKDVEDKRKHATADALCRFLDTVYAILPAAWVDQLRISIIEAASKLKSTERISDGVKELCDIMKEIDDAKNA